jgi:Zn-dependent protease with chaperone function
MILPYFSRLLCLCFACFFLTNAALGLAARVCSRVSTCLTARMKASTAAHLLLALRLLPGALAVFVVAGLCIPSYLWLEPDGTRERVGIICTVLGLLGVTTWTSTLGRVGRALVDSMRFNRLCGQETREIYIAGKKFCASVVGTDAPLLAMAGMVRPRLIVSRGVLEALSLEELDAALRHENAHRLSGDNCKRFLVLLAPDILPFLRGFGALEQTWAKLAEWAADDEATGGDKQRALSLAGALVRVARMGAGPRLSFLHTSLVAGDEDFSARVQRLLRPELLARHARWPIWSLGGLFLAACLAGLLVWPATLFSFHQLLEVFLR